MKLSKVASYFDRTVCQDAYGAATFRGQFNLYDDATRDGLGSVRRILSTAPNISMPGRGVVRVEGKEWIVGGLHPDFFNGAAIRHKFILHQADGLAALRSFEQAIAAAGGVEAYAAVVWIKTAKQVEVSSTLVDVFEILFASVEEPSVPSIVTLAGRDYIVQSVYPTEGGFTAAHAVELPAAHTNVVVANRNYIPATDSWNESIITVPAIQLRWQDHFKYFAQYSRDYEAGDLQVLVRKADVAQLKAGDHVTVGVQTYRVIVAYDENAIWSAQVRPA